MNNFSNYNVSEFAKAILDKLENHALRIKTLEEKNKIIDNWEVRFNKLETRMEKFEQDQRAIILKLMESIEMIKQIGSVRNHILTAMAALGGVIAAYLIHLIH